ncbi:MAG: diguanylate cyclase [Firmicutes bacterium]|nr:diguanylate cyclase [Bacillota bacterium]
MEYNYVYSVICLVSSALLLSLSFLSMVHLKATPSSRPFSLLMVFSAIYVFGYAFEIMKGDPGWIFFWLRVEYLGVPFLAACWLWLAMEFTGRVRYLKPLLPVLLGISFCFLLSVYTNNLHHLYYSSIEIDDSGPFQMARLGKGVLYLANSLWIISLLAASAGLYVVHYFRTPSIFRKQTRVMIAGALWSLVGFVFYQAGGGPRNLDIIPMVLTIDGFIFAYGVFRSGLFDISPIARDKVFESMKEGVIVTDLGGVIADFNPAAEGFLPGLSRGWVGKNLLEVVPEFAANSNSDSPFELENSEGLQYYEIRKVPVMVRPGKSAGTAWYMRQVTEQHNLFARLKTYAERDELTGIWNRRVWLELAKNEIARAERYGCSLSLVLIDIDHFKGVNDEMGHETGDRVLVSIVNAISSGLRKSDIFGRLGGEEFAVILPETNRETAAVVSERLLQAVFNHRIEFQGKRHTVTISAGIAVCENGSMLSIEELLRKADKALYQAKESGRNRACFADP